MILSLDHLIFGNGRGIRSPFWDNRFYWLSGEVYTYMAGFGAQLHSYQWTHPRAGETRHLCGRDFVPLHSSRRWFRVEVAWSWVGLPKDIDEANAELRQLEKELGSEHYGDGNYNRRDRLFNRKAAA
jgi:hypothetical protein